MKKPFMICLFWVVLALISGPAFAIEYRMDLLETDNPGGWSASKKTFDTKWIKDQKKEVSADIWLHDVPEPLIAAGFYMHYDPSKVSLTAVDIYDGSALPGPWVGGMTKKVQDASGPGTYQVFCIHMSNATPDKNGDIIIAKVHFLCNDKCDTPITITAISIPGFDTIVGGNSSHVYDAEIKPITLK